YRAVMPALSQPRHDGDRPPPMRFQERRETLRVRAVDVAIFAGMDAAGDVEHVDAVVVGALDVGQHAVADGDDVAYADVAAEDFARRLQRRVVDRPMRLA